MGLREDSPERARIPESQQRRLFALSVREFLAESLPLEWRRGATERLEELTAAGLLSFTPADAHELSHPQEAELFLLLSLLEAGGDITRLRALLTGLSAPYQYDLDRLRYDWRARRWRYWAPAELDWPRVERWLQGRAEAGDVAAIYSSLERSAKLLRRLAFTEQEGSS